MVPFDEVIESVTVAINQIAGMVTLFPAGVAPDLTANVKGIHTIRPEVASVDAAMKNMLAPSILVNHIGVSPGSYGGFSTYQHNIEVIFKCQMLTSSSTGTSFYDATATLLNGIVDNGDDLDFLNATIDDRFLPIFASGTPSVRPTVLENMDFWIVSFGMIEIPT